jgi:hypothetical protein
MANFGWFKTQRKSPSVVYKADFMEMDGEYVKLYNRNADLILPPVLVAAIRLDKGQDVRMLK